MASHTAAAATIVYARVHINQPLCESTNCVLWCARTLNSARSYTLNTPQWMMSCGLCSPKLICWLFRENTTTQDNKTATATKQQTDRTGRGKPAAGSKDGQASGPVAVLTAHSVLAGVNPVHHQQRQKAPVLIDMTSRYLARV